MGEFNGRRFTLQLSFSLDYRLRLWVSTFASRAISAVAELLVTGGVRKSISLNFIFVLLLPKIGISMQGLCCSRYHSLIINLVIDRLSVPCMSLC